jgi:hypothetical protein
VVKPTPEVVAETAFAQALRRTMKRTLRPAPTTRPQPACFYALLNVLCDPLPASHAPSGSDYPVALICTSTLATMRHRSPDLIAGYLVAVATYYAGVYLGARDRSLGDEPTRHGAGPHRADAPPCTGPPTPCRTPTDARRRDVAGLISAFLPVFIMEFRQSDQTLPGRLGVLLFSFLNPRLPALLCVPLSFFSVEC